jgi:hypothetical protein
MVSDKTLVIMDTNKTRSTLDGLPRYDGFDLGRDFTALKNFIDENNLSEIITIAITEMTLKELLNQKKRVYDEDVMNLKQAISRLKHLENVSIPKITLPEDSFDCITYLTPKVEAFLRENNIEVIKIEAEKKSLVLDVLIQNVIDVKPPFRLGRNNNSSGHGFKDAVIWETLNHSSLINNYKNVILLTDDSDFDNCKINSDKINFKTIKLNADLIDELKVLYAKNLREKKYADLSTNNYLISNIKQMIASELDSIEDSVNIVSLTDDIIDTPSQLKEKFTSIDENEEYFENMVCFVGKIKVLDIEYVVNVLIDLGSNEIETIQVESVT